MINVKVLFLNGTWTLIRHANLRLMQCLPELVLVHSLSASHFTICYDARLMSQLQTSADEAVVGYDVWSIDVYIVKVLV